MRAAMLRWSRGALATAALICTVSQASLSGEESLEYTVKANYLYKFGEYVEWPATAFASADSAMKICIVGHDPFGAALDKAVAGQRVGERPITVLRMDTVTKESGCQIAYLGGSDAQSVAQAADEVRGAGVLTVTDSVQGDTAGAVHFVIAGNRVRFNIDEQTAVDNGVGISSKLLSLAASVKPKA